jgi:hypothetical protein
LGKGFLNLYTDPVSGADDTLDAMIPLLLHRCNAGGPGAWRGMLRSVGGIQNGFITKKIDLPRDWDKLVEKYKDIVPNYIGY